MVEQDELSQTMGWLHSCASIAPGRSTAFDKFVRLVPAELAALGFNQCGPREPESFTRAGLEQFGIERYVERLVKYGLLERRKHAGADEILLPPGTLSKLEKSSQHGHRTNGTLPKPPLDSAVTCYPFYLSAEEFSLITGSEYEALKADIHEHGLLNPITVYQGTILDGRNRYLACRDLGLELRTVEWNGKGSPLAFVTSQNFRRRHHNVSQRAMIAAKLMPKFEQEANERMLSGKTANPGTNLSEGRARDQAARAVNVSAGSVETARKVLKNGIADLVKAVENGLVSVAAAGKVAELPKAEQALVVAAGAESIKAKAKEFRDAKAKASTRANKQSQASAEEVTANGSQIIADKATPSMPQGGNAAPLTLAPDFKAEDVAEALLKFFGPTMSGEISSALSKLLVS